jgi:hypothetical protein
MAGKFSPTGKGLGRLATVKRGVSLEQRIEDGAHQCKSRRRRFGVLHISRDAPPHFAVKPLNANEIELDAFIVAGVCDNQYGTARKSLILKTERCPSG